MAKRILVPLDQTTDAEAVLPLVADAARGSGAVVRLLHIAPVPERVVGAGGHVVAYADQEMERLRNEGMDYLQAVEARLESVPVECQVRFGSPVEEILLEADAFQADLIAMTTRSRHALSRIVLGSTAEQVCRKAAAPVLMFRPGAWRTE